MKKKLLIIPSMLALLSLTGCTENNADLNSRASGTQVDILLNASEGYTFENGKPSMYLNVHKGVNWGAVKASAPKKVKDLNGNYYDIPSKDASGNPKNYWVIGEETNPISDDYRFDTNTTLNAHIVPSSKVTITLNPKGGTWKSGSEKGQSTVRTYTCDKGTVWSTIKNDFGVTAPASTTFIGFSTTEEGSAIADTYVFDEDTTLYARNVGTVTYADFTTDTWEVFNTLLVNADPVSAIKTAYNKTSLIGLKRSVTLWGVNYNIVVIGENTDTIYNSTNKAALTFQFEDAIETGIGFNNDMYNYYYSAAIRGYLNQSFYNQLQDEVKKNIKVVSKRAYETLVEEKVIEYPEKIFLPSFNEVGITKFNIGYDVECQEEGFLDTDTSKYNKPYAYYSTGTETELKAKRTKKYYENPVTHVASEGVAVDYWLRSVDYESDDSVYYIKSAGTAPTDGSYEADIGLAIAPIFCLGEVAA